MPIDLMYSATSSGSACERAAASGYSANSAGVTLFTLLSVVCAESTTQIRSSNISICSSAQPASG